MAIDFKQRERAFSFVGSDRYNDLIQNIIPKKMKDHMKETGDNFMYKTDLYFISKEELDLLFDSIFLLDTVKIDDELPFKNNYVEINNMRFERVEDIGVSFSIELI